MAVLCRPALSVSMRRLFPSWWFTELGGGLFCCSLRGDIVLAPLIFYWSLGRGYLLLHFGYDYDESVVFLLLLGGNELYELDLVGIILVVYVHLGILRGNL